MGQCCGWLPRRTDHSDGGDLQAVPPLGQPQRDHPDDHRHRPPLRRRQRAASLAPDGQLAPKAFAIEEEPADDPAGGGASGDAERQPVERPGGERDAAPGRLTEQVVGDQVRAGADKGRDCRDEDDRRHQERQRSGDPLVVGGAGDRAEDRDRHRRPPRGRGDEEGQRDQHRRHQPEGAPDRARPDPHHLRQPLGQPRLLHRGAEDEGADHQPHDVGGKGVEEPILGAPAGQDQQRHRRKGHVGGVERGRRPEDDRQRVDEQRQARVGRQRRGQQDGHPGRGRQGQRDGHVEDPPESARLRLRDWSISPRGVDPPPQARLSWSEDRWGAWLISATHRPSFAQLRPAASRSRRRLRPAPAPARRRPQGSSARPRR